MSEARQGQEIIHYKLSFEGSISASRVADLLRVLQSFGTEQSVRLELDTVEATEETKLSENNPFLEFISAGSSDSTEISLAVVSYESLKKFEEIYAHDHTSRRAQGKARRVYQQLLPAIEEIGCISHPGTSGKVFIFSDVQSFVQQNLSSAESIPHVGDRTTEFLYEYVAAVRSWEFNKSG